MLRDVLVRVILVVATASTPQSELGDHRHLTELPVNDEVSPRHFVVGPGRSGSWPNTNPAFDSSLASKEGWYGTLGSETSCARPSRLG